MTASEMMEHVGKVGVVTMGTLKFEVVVIDCRERFGSLDYKVEPLAGGGTAWMLETSVSQLRAPAERLNGP
jgi:hypothetical protein